MHLKIAQSMFMSIVLTGLAHLPQTQPGAHADVYRFSYQFKSFARGDEWLMQKMGNNCI